MQDNAIQLAVIDMAGTTVADDGLVVSAFESAATRGRPARSRGRSATTPGSTCSTPWGSPRSASSVHCSAPRSWRSEPTRPSKAPMSGSSTRAGQSRSTVPHEAITRLREAGIKVALTTGFSGTTQEKLLAALGWQALADLVLAPGNGVRGRPSPDLILTALMRLDVDGVHNVAVARRHHQRHRKRAARRCRHRRGHAHRRPRRRPTPRRGGHPRRRLGHRIRRPDPAKPLTQRRNHEATYPPARAAIATVAATTAMTAAAAAPDRRVRRPARP